MPFTREPELDKTEKKATISQRLSVIEDRLRQMELSSTEPGASASYEELQEIRSAVINALHGLRSQGAYNLARGLEEKYFEGQDVRGVGDLATTTAILKSGGA